MSSFLRASLAAALAMVVLPGCRGDDPATGASASGDTDASSSDGNGNGNGSGTGSSSGSVGGGGAGPASSTASTSSGPTGPAGPGGGPFTPDTLWPAPGCDASPAPAIEKPASGGSTALVLKGFVVTPAKRFAGEVLVVGETIACAAESCSGEAGYSNAAVVQTNGVIFPGLIDLHNHVLFDAFDEADWTPEKAYGDHDDWPNEKRYKAMVDTKQYLNGEGQNAVELGCELNKYGELKGVIGGTTSMVGSANPGNKKCYGSLARTIDQSSNDLGVDHVQAGTLFPSTESADSICGNLNDGSTKSYLMHIAEGVNETARGEFYKLGTVTSVDDCLYSPQTSVVHGTALGKVEFEKMAAVGMGLVWSPRSNVFLYGLSQDYSKTTDIPLVRSLGIRVALAPDWSLGGSVNLLEELRFADAVDQNVWGDVLTPDDLLAMVTTTPAELLKYADKLGSLEKGKLADVLVVEGSGADPVGALLRARAENVRLVLVGGRVLYGDNRLVGVSPDESICEPLTVCCGQKFVCFAESAGDADKLTQSFSEVKTSLETALVDYDAKDLSEWNFAPLAPLTTCK